MKAVLKTGAPWIVAAVAVLGFLLARVDRALQPAEDLTVQVGRLLRYQAAHYQWERMVSDRMHWPPPPNPDEMAVKDGTCGAGDEPAGLLAATP